MSEATIKAALEDLSARGITTLEQFVASTEQAATSHRINAEAALQELSGPLAPSDPSYRSTIGAPDPSVVIVLDGKRVEYEAVARLSDRPLDYIATTLADGTPALVVFSDRSIMRNHHVRQVQSSVALQAIRDEVDSALLMGGLRAAAPARAADTIGVRIFTGRNHTGDSTVLPPEWYIPNLKDFHSGLGLFGGNWNDRIVSVDLVAHTKAVAWEHANRGGASLTLFDAFELDSIGWQSRISSIETWYQI
jgi:hypothetical protein